MSDNETPDWLKAIDQPGFYDSLIPYNNTKRGKRAKTKDFIRGFGSMQVYAKAHAWNPNNMRAICGVVIVKTDNPRQPFTRSNNDCATCARQWDWWAEQGLTPTSDGA